MNENQIADITDKFADILRERSQHLDFTSRFRNVCKAIVVDPASGDTFIVTFKDGLVIDVVENDTLPRWLSGEQEGLST